MAKFPVRVELLDAEEADYDTLWDEMKAEGFKRTVKDSDGVKCRLPPAEYSYRGDATRDDVLTKAKAAAAKTGKKHRILVTESAGRTWHNLEKV